VKGSIEAFEMYCRAFGAEINFEIKDDNGAYAHSELTINGQFFMCVSECGLFNEIPSEQTHLTMAFNVPGLGSEEAVRKAHDILSKGGKTLHLGALCGIGVEVRIDLYEQPEKNSKALR